MTSSVSASSAAITSVKAGSAIDRFNVAFPHAQASHTGSIVLAIPKPFVEQHADQPVPSNVGRVCQLAAEKEAHNIDKVFWRLSAVSGIGAKGAWGRWHKFIPQNCKAVGFKCVNWRKALQMACNVHLNRAVCAASM